MRIESMMSKLISSNFKLSATCNKNFYEFNRTVNKMEPSEAEINDILACVKRFPRSGPISSQKLLFYDKKKLACWTKSFFFCWCFASLSCSRIKWQRERNNYDIHSVCCGSGREKGFLPSCCCLPLFCPLFGISHFRSLAYDAYDNDWNRARNRVHEPLRQNIILQSIERRAAYAQPNGASDYGRCFRLRFVETC